MSERRSELKAVAASEDATGAKAVDQDLIQLSARMFDGWTQVNGRLIAMAQNSLRHNLAAADELRQCQSPTDVMDIQLKLAKQAYDDCVDEAKKLSDLVVKVSSEAFGPFNMSR